MFLESGGVVNEDARDAVMNADLIVLGPGDLYTSIIPNLLVKDFSKTLIESRAKKVYITNLMPMSN